MKRALTGAATYIRRKWDEQEQEIIGESELGPLVYVCTKDTVSGVRQGLVIEVDEVYKGDDGTVKVSGEVLYATLPKRYRLDHAITPSTEVLIPRGSTRRLPEKFHVAVSYTVFVMLSLFMVLDIILWVHGDVPWHAAVTKIALGVTLFATLWFQTSGWRMRKRFDKKVAALHKELEAEKNQGAPHDLDNTERH